MNRQEKTDPDPTNREILANILYRPCDYKACEVCHSVVIKEVVLCPRCQGYRFNKDRDVVIHYAKRQFGSQESQNGRKMS